MKKLEYSSPFLEVCLDELDRLLCDSAGQNQVGLDYDDTEIGLY